jgi:hypothetical protein
MRGNCESIFDSKKQIIHKSFYKSLFVLFVNFLGGKVIVQIKVGGTVVVEIKVRGVVVAEIKIERILVVEIMVGGIVVLEIKV